MTPYPPGEVPPGKLACESCGVELVDECVPSGPGRWLCPVCAGAACFRCRTLTEESYRVDASGLRACAGCLTPEEQLAVGLEAGATRPEIFP